MSERAPPQRQPHYITEIASVPLEAMTDLGNVKTQLEAAVFDFIGFQVSRALDGENPEPPTETLKEKYDLEYDPEKTVRSIGAVGIAFADPEVYLKKHALDAAELTRAA